MQELEKALEEVERQTFDFTTARAENPPSYRTAQAQKPEGFLYFPRKKLRMRKIKSGRWTPMAWFIEKRLRHTATELKKPVSISKEGLTSGYRSAIVLNNRGEYVKLKGVAMKSLGAQGGKRGIGGLNEAFLELIHSHGFYRRNFHFLAIHPLFFEAHISPKEEASLSDFLPLFQSPAVCMYLKDDKKPIGNDLIRIIGKNGEDEHKLSRLNIVTAYKIRGDTRLDEAVWHLTKRELRGREEENRNSLLDMLFFRAGAAKAHLAIEGFGWGYDLVHTNSHIGNFVVYPAEGVINIALADLGIMKFEENITPNSIVLSSTETPEKAAFQAHLHQELEGFKDDIFDHATYSMTAQQRYRFFPQDLRKRCLDSLKTGYYVAMLKFRKKYKEIAPIIPRDSKVIIPERCFIADKEFREECRTLAS